MVRFLTVELEGKGGDSKRPPAPPGLWLDAVNWLSTMRTKPSLANAWRCVGASHVLKPAWVSRLGTLHCQILFMRNQLEDVALGTFATIECDCFFGMGSACILLLVDTWTKFVETKPLKTKNQTTIGEAIQSFLDSLRSRTCACSRSASSQGN